MPFGTPANDTGGDVPAPSAGELGGDALLRLDGRAEQVERRGGHDAVLAADVDDVLRGRGGAGLRWLEGAEVAGATVAATRTARVRATRTRRRRMGVGEVGGGRGRTVGSAERGRPRVAVGSRPAWSPTPSFTRSNMLDRHRSEPPPACGVARRPDHRWTTDPETCGRCCRRRRTPPSSWSISRTPPLYFGDPDMAEEVGELEEQMNELVHDMRAVCILAVRSPRRGRGHGVGAPGDRRHRAHRQRRRRHRPHRHPPARHPPRAGRRPLERPRRSRTGCSSARARTWPTAR